MAAAQPVARRKPGPKAGAKRAQQAKASPASGSVSSLGAPPAVPPMVAAAAATPSRDPLQRHRNIQLMGEDELRSYALQVGVSKRDAAELSVDRLKANCVLMVQSVIESL